MYISPFYRNIEDNLIHVYAGENIHSVKSQQKEKQDYKNKKHKKEDDNQNMGAENNHDNSTSIDIRC